jgi:hypothetical protein
VEDVNIKKLQKHCWDAKPIIKDLVDEVKFLLDTCWKNSEDLTSFLQRFVERAFNFACNLEEKDVAGINEDRTCFRGKEDEFGQCVAAHFPTRYEFSDHGICE